MPQHGRISTEKARLLSYGVDPDTGEIHCEGVVRQSSVFGEALEMRRHIRLGLDTNDLTIEDVVINRGFKPTGHAMLYHFNFGYPFLGRDIEVTGLPDALSDTMRSDPAVPGEDYGQRVDLVASEDLAAGGVVCATNRSVDVVMEMAFDTGALPKFAVWRAYRSGIFALGLEPRTAPADVNHPLLSGEHRHYRIRLALASARSAS